MIEYAAGAVEFDEAFFFGAEFGGMGDEAAAGTACRVLDVKHFVIEDVLDGNLRDGGMIHSAIQEDLIGAGVVTPELATPASRAPADVGPLQLPFEIFPVQLVE